MMYMYEMYVVLIAEESKEDLREVQRRVEVVAGHSPC